MSKKSQITAFIIAGLFVLIVFSVILYARSNMPPIGQALGIGSSSNNQVDLSDVETLLNSCLDEASSKALASFPETGSNIIECNLKDSTKINIGYGTEDDLSEAIRNKLKDNFNLCINDFAALNSRAISFDKTKPIFTVSINEADIFIKLEYPVDIKIGNSVKTADAIYTRFSITRFSI